MTDLFGDDAGTATLSACGTYRYDLTRRWGDGPLALFTMVNPSSADAERNDQTMWRCIHFSQRWGMGGLVVLNLFALRSSWPSLLYDHDDPVGPDNDETIERWLRAPDVELVVVAWGAHGAHQHRDRAVYEAIVRHRGEHPLCLGTTKHGHPKHPLARGRSRVPDDFQPVPFRFGEAE